MKIIQALTLVLGYLLLTTSTHGALIHLINTPESPEMKLVKEKQPEPLQKAVPFFFGADCSSLLLVEKEGTTFLDERGYPRDPLWLLAQRGMNLLRLRLWNNPPGGEYNLSYVIQLAKRAKTHGLQILLDYHFSDSWADPSHQTPPLSWQNLSFSELQQQLATYIHVTLSRMKDEGVFPSIIQLGNEIECGILWEYGNICDSTTTGDQWDQFTQLLKTAVNAVRDLNTSVPIALHTSLAGQPEFAHEFYWRLLHSGVQFEYIGLSYYPWWHGPLSLLNKTLWQLVTLDRPLLILETAYPWTLQWADETQNIVGLPSQLLPGYPATPWGQALFLANLTQLLRNLPHSLGRGVVYWEPAWQGNAGFGSPWENLALFSFEGRILSTLFMYTYLSTSHERSIPRT